MEEPRLPKPSQQLAFFVVWRNFGTYMIKAFATPDEARDAYNDLIVLAETAKPRDQHFEVYIGLLIASHESEPEW